MTSKQHTDTGMGGLVNERAEMTENLSEPRGSIVLPYSSASCCNFYYTTRNRDAKRA